MTYFSTVWIACLGVQTTIFLDVLKGVVHQPTFTALVTLRVGAVHQLLFTKGHKLPRLDCMLAFH